MTREALLKINGLKVSVFGDEGEASILDHVELELKRGEILGVVGESGCGKSTLMRAILGLLPQSAQIVSGEILFRGENLLSLSKADMARRIRGRAVGFVPQDPFLAFNPVFTVGKQMMEILRWSGIPGHRPGGRLSRERVRQHRARLIEMFRAVQIPDAETVLDRYPHQFSGGQRQRILIAGALAAQPEIILADEPTTALDVTTQAQILTLLNDLSDQFGVSILFVTHDFGAVAQLCHRVSVMYAGQTVEVGTADHVINRPQHPYTSALIDCHPDHIGDLVGIPGQVASPLSAPPGCRFHPRCAVAQARCSAARPPLTAHEGRAVSCIHWAAP
ncbi:MAG: ABC transporter ATP-binding protein [Pseudomonadota bacterium]